MEKTTRRFGLGTRVFATDPWTVIRRSVEKRCPSGVRKEAGSLLEQSEDFYRAAKSGVRAAKPVLLYYCFLNLAKVYILVVRQRQSVNDAKHGLAEKIGPSPNDKELLNAYLQAHKTVLSPGAKINLFDDFLLAISGDGLTTDRFELPTLLPQVVPGHRLWVEGDSAKTKERFVSLEKIEFWENTNEKQIWLRLYLFADDLKRMNLSHQDLLSRSNLDHLVREVVCDKKKEADDRPLICLEQLEGVKYTGRPSDRVHDLVATLRHKLWRTILATPPYRKYYLYAAPVQEHAQVLPQILSIYAITYYLGSITRYRPHHFDTILSASFGPFVEAFLNDQPAQFIYLMASEFAEKEVTKAAIV
jgi:hypothetical protein